MAGLETAPERITQLNAAPPASGPVLYWMSRDQRVQGNWALALAQERAAQAKAPLAVLFCLADGFLDAQPWHFAFMLDGLRETSRELEKLNIPFFVMRGSPESEIPRFAQKCRAGLAVCDFDPLSIKQRWAERTAKALKMPLLEVDAHNIVPCRHVSQKREAGAYTLRPKLNRLLPGFLTAFPEIKRQKTAWSGPAPEKLPPSPEQKGTAGSRCIFRPGRAAALARLGTFVKNGLAAYENGRNDPSLDALSGL
ncbi:MAG: deoxyribodipyrimidine photolyase, partial [Elusimicrobia bacterium]|nr:deoxyribodipyrimidine photolyase [Elusimicrobiota bacterium]